MIDTVFEIGYQMFFINRCFGYVLGYAKDDCFTLQYGNDKTWYIETWHGVDGVRIMDFLDKLGWEKI